MKSTSSNDKSSSPKRSHQGSFEKKRDEKAGSRQHPSKWHNVERTEHGTIEDVPEEQAP